MKKVIYLLLMLSIASVAFSEEVIMKEGPSLGLPEDVVVLFVGDKEIAREKEDVDRNSTLIRGEVSDGVVKEYDEDVLSCEFTYKKSNFVP